ncbi:MAG: EAL domain-containing protein [Sterolibacteriaceae bacterium]|nr:EAL domain-containing protein [Sterolibacteriaceae bacterium]MBK9084459.1 EAL domain-containing protein [Sterolibacteriaceae bacterium]
MADRAWSAATGEASAGPSAAWLIVLAVLALVVGLLMWRLRASHDLRIAHSNSAAALATQLEQLRSAHDKKVMTLEEDLARVQAELAAESARRETAQAVAIQTTHKDALTQLPNRLGLQEDLSQAVAAAERSGQNPSVLLVDLDDFKRINDTLGHGVGDEMIRLVAQRLSACVAPSGEKSGPGGSADFVARVGGDEFAILVRSVSDRAALSKLAEQVAESLRQPFTVGGYKTHTSASLGIACFPKDGQDGDTLLKNADMAMFRAKALGKDGIQFYSHAMSVAASRRMAVENGLRKALEEQHLALRYQPKVESGTWRITGVEALVRWRSPTHGLILPGNFIEIAEQTGLIAQIGEWVLLEACKQQRAWQDNGLAPIQMAVNVSSMQFREDHLLAAVVAAIKQSGILPGFLQLEVTENLFMKNMTLARNTLEYVRGLGATVAIDDFGTGYSSFGYLRELPVDCIKIDRSFVRELDARPDDREIARAIVNLAHALSVKTVAEGVETRVQADLLAETGCDEMQGFVFAPPVDANQMMRILRQGVLPPGSPYALSPATQAPAEASPADGEADTSSYELHAQATQVVPASWAADG